MPGAYRGGDLLSLCNEMTMDIVIQKFLRIFEKFLRDDGILVEEEFQDFVSSEKYPGSVERENVPSSDSSLNRDEIDC